MYFIGNVDNTNVECLHYTDDEGAIQEYCFEQDIEITQNLGQYLAEINFVSTVFGFQDLIDSGFTFDYLFAGWLNNANANLPNTNGFVIGVTKNNGLFPNGARVILDPTVVDVSQTGITNYGNPIIKDSDGNLWVVYEAVAAPTNTDIFVAKSTDNGATFSTFNLTSTADFNESQPHIDVNSTDGIIIQYDKASGAAATTDIFITTCSSGGCDAAAEFLSDINVSACGIALECSNGNLDVDQNDFSHISYAKQNFARYRRNTGFVGGTWSAEEDTNANTETVNISTQIVVAKNGSDKRLAVSTANGAQISIGFFDGTTWGAINLFVNPQVNTPPSAFGGYDGNFYIAYAQGSEAENAPPKNVHLTFCSQDTNCAAIGNWTDLNVTESPNQNDYFVSMFQANDLNVHILSSARVNDADANIHHYVMLPDGTITSSSIADGNLLFSDSNQTYNPLFRNRDYLGSAVDVLTNPPIGNSSLDYIFLTAIDSTGDPSTVVFDSNALANINGITSRFTVVPASPFTLNAEQGVTNVNVDFNSTSIEFGILDANYSWVVDGTEESTDQNFNRDFNGSDTDFNISLIVNGNDGTTHFTSQSDQNVLVRNVGQYLDINVTFNVFSSNADVNYGVTSSNPIDAVSWGGTDIDFNRSGLQFRFDYNAEGLKQVCAVVTSSDVNNIVCEVFRVTRALVKRPLDEETPATVLTNFSVTVDGTAPQNYAEQENDLNVFVFDQNESQYININVDFNTSYFPRNYGIFTTNNTLFFEIQPYLALVANSIQVNWITQDVLSNSSLSNIKITSQRSISSVLTEVESPFTDITGLATLTFIPQVPYTLTFDLNGVVLGIGTYIPASSDTEKKAFLDVTDINTGTFIQSALDVNLTPAGGVIVLPSDFNSTQITQDINVLDGTLESLRILVTHGSFTLSDTNHSAEGTFTQTLELGGRDLNTSVVVQVTAVISGQNYLVRKTYTLRTGDGLEQIATTAKDQDIGFTGAVIISVLITTIFVGAAIRTMKSENQDNSNLSFFAIPILMFFAFIGWVPWIPIIFGSAGAMILYFSRRASSGGFA
jgi:hypothetical protein